MRPRARVYQCKRKRKWEIGLGEGAADSGRIRGVSLPGAVPMLCLH